MDLQLKNKTAIVTGGSAGIGLAIVQSLTAEGVHVTVPGRSKEKLEAALKGIPNVRAIEADVATAAGAQSLIDQVPTTDILINNLGTYEVKAFADITDADWLSIFETNVLSGVRLSRHYFPQMLARNEGRIIFISSESGVMTPAEMIHYGVTKSSQLAISRGLAELTKGTAVTVNSVMPGPTRSEGIVDFLKNISSLPTPLPNKPKKSSSKNTVPALFCSASKKPPRSPTWSPSSPARSPPPPTEQLCAPKADCSAPSSNPEHSLTDLQSVSP
jgi:NAD(P)-dependent dehydrogenase (short-subunit alcohol dehydrogenase family)